MTHPENQKRQEPADAERDDHLKHETQQVTNQHADRSPENKPTTEDHLESGDNAAQRDTDAMDETSPEGQRTLRDEGF